MHLASKCAFGVLLLGVVLAVAACNSTESSEELKTEMSALADAGEWKEIESRIELRESRGEKGPVLDFFMGWAQLSQDEDRPAEGRLERAVAADSNLAFDVASIYRAAALRDIEEGWEKRGARRMRNAYLLDGITELGGLGGPVAGLLFKDDDYLAAIPLLRHLLSGDAEVLEKQRWTFALGFSLGELGLREAALEQYRSYWSQWGGVVGPSYTNHVLWRLGLSLLAFAEERMERGDCEGALRYLDEVLEVKATPEHRGIAHLRIGLCLEDLNRIDEARENYRRVLDFPSGEGGGVHEEARQRLRDLSAASNR